jgi:hypothetical protein
MAAYSSLKNTLEILDGGRGGVGSSLAILVAHEFAARDPRIEHNRARAIETRRRRRDLRRGSVRNPKCHPPHRSAIERERDARCDLAASVAPPFDVHLQFGYDSPDQAHLRRVGRRIRGGEVVAVAVQQRPLQLQVCPAMKTSMSGAWMASRTQRASPARTLASTCPPRISASRWRSHAT